MTDLNVNDEVRIRPYITGVKGKVMDWAETMAACDQFQAHKVAVMVNGNYMILDRDNVEKVEKTPPLRTTSYFIDTRDASVWEYQDIEEILLCISTPKKHIPAAAIPDSFKALHWKDD